MRKWVAQRSFFHRCHRFLLELWREQHPLGHEQTALIAIPFRPRQFVPLVPMLNVSHGTDAKTIRRALGKSADSLGT
jgi:hypothetical protein